MAQIVKPEVLQACFSTEANQPLLCHAALPTQDTRIPDSVIRIMRHKGSIGEGIDHPAVFPVALPEFVINAYSDAGDLVFEPFSGSGSTLLASKRTHRRCSAVVLDPFGGSGTTVIACEKSGRRARLIELDPKYVDVIVLRWQEFSAQSAFSAGTTDSFADVAAQPSGQVISRAVA